MLLHRILFSSHCTETRKGFINTMPSPFHLATSIQPCSASKARSWTWSTNIATLLRYMSILYFDLKLKLIPILICRKANEIIFREVFYTTFFSGVAKLFLRERESQNFLFSQTMCFKKIYFVEYRNYYHPEKI